MSEFSSVEFLNENELRDYPLLEGSSLPRDLILDARVFSRGDRNSTCKISSIQGSSVSGSGLLELHFDTGCLSPDGMSTDVVIVEVPEPDPGKNYVQAFGWNPSPFGENLPSSPGGTPGSSSAGLWSSVSVTVGASGIQSVSGMDEAPESADLEPSLVYLGSSTSIHQLSVGPPEDLNDISGELHVLQGRNTTTEILGGALLIDAEKGNGEPQLTIPEFISLYEIDATEEEVTSPCLGAIRKVNGIGPDTSGQFSILDGQGLSVRSFPESHMIVITTAFAMQSKACPELPDFDDVYLWTLDDEGNLIPTDALPGDLEPGQVWTLDQFGRLVPAEEFDFDPYWTEEGGGLRPT